MPLTPEEQAELNQLQQELAPKATGGLTPEEQAELASLQAELAPPKPTETISPLVSGAAGIAQGGTAGFADEITAGVGAVGAKAKDLLGFNDQAKQDLQAWRGDATPVADPTLTDLYRQKLAGSREQYGNSQTDNPEAYMGGQVIGGALTSAAPGGLIAQGAVQGLGDSTADLTKGDFLGAAKDVAIGAGTSAAFGGALKAGGAALGAGTRALSKAGSKVGDFLADTKYGKAYLGGKEVQKFTSEGVQTDLANKVSKAIEEKVTAARMKHAEARKSYLDQVGDKTLDTSDVVLDSYQSANRAGPGVMGADGKIMGSMAPNELAMLDNYATTIADPKSAQELYTVWDDLKRQTDHFDSVLQGAPSEINNQLKLLQAGIKEKLRSLGAGLPEADDAFSAFSSQADHLKRGASETSNESFLSTLGNKNRGNRKDAFQEVLSDRPDLLKEVDNFQTYQRFNTQGGSGSEEGVKTAVGIIGGGALGYAAGGDGSSSTIGSLAGSVLSRGRVQRAILTNAGQAGETIMSALPKLPPQYTQALTEAAKRGGNSLAITHFILGQKDPTYQAATKKDDK